MLQCGCCSRHVRAIETVCPFCGHTIATTAAPSPLRLTAMVLTAGLGLLACTTGTGEEGAGVTTMMGSATETTDASETMGTTLTTTGDGDGDVTTESDSERGGEAYAAPEDIPCQEFALGDVAVGDNLVMTGDSFVWQTCGGIDSQPSIYTFTAGEPGDYEFAVIDADFSPVISLLGIFCDPPEELACALAPESVTLTLDVGETVHVAIGSVEGSNGSATLSIVPPA